MFHDVCIDKKKIKKLTIMTLNLKAPPTLTERKILESKSHRAGHQDHGNDFDTSVEILCDSFITWHRLQHNGIVTVQTRNDIQYADNWHQRYPENFQILHRGSRCEQSLLIGQGKYSKVYQRGAMAYKIVKLGHNRTQENLSKLRCNIKELCFFHSMDHGNVTPCSRSQMVMFHGTFKKIIHEMARARCTLENMIYNHEITCYQDLVYMMKGIAQGLSYMHQYRIVHGDIKPSNILVSQRYECQISDFTLTTFEQKGDDMAFGTLYWRSPECLLKETCGTASDVWAFGVMILDALYGCFYLKDVMHARDNNDMLFKLNCLLTPPDTEWLEAHLTPIQREHMSLPVDSELVEAVRTRQIQITVSEDQLVLVKDLVASILKWDVQQRPTMKEVLDHPFFQSRVVAPVPQHSEDPLIDAPLLWCYQAREKVWVIHWRDRSEKEFIQREFKNVYFKLLKTEWSPNEQWLLDDTVVLAKRIVDRLKIMETTFDMKHLIHVCCEFCFFVWKNYWPEDDPLFESSMFHILNLLHFNVMAFNVKEIFLHENQPSHDQPQPSVFHDQPQSATRQSATPHNEPSLFTVTLANGKTLQLSVP